MNYRRWVIAFSLICSVATCSVVQAQEVSEQFKRLDSNQDGKVTKEEFPGALFSRIDANKDDVITAEEDRAFARNNQARNNQPSGPRVPGSVEAVMDVAYAGTDNARQKLDLYLPKDRKADQALPVVVFIHGGGWQGGDKRGGYRWLAPMVESGEYVGVSVGYRLSDEAVWPAQIHDCKAAIRWIAANAQKYNLDASKIGVTGTSAGGHLVAMLGTTGDVPEVEGKLGEHLKASSRVKCVVDQFGPTDMLTMGASHDTPSSPVSKLLGGTAQENQEAARSASPTSYVSKDDPPFLFIHGTEDRTVPFKQSELLHAALLQVGVDSVLVSVPGGGHGNFGTDEVSRRTQQFFDKYLRSKDVLISVEPIRLGRE